jgi:TetR/AcrR family transcriptional regulator, transcriptional repressor for nem operon
LAFFGLAAFKFTIKVDSWYSWMIVRVSVMTHIETEKPVSTRQQILNVAQTAVLSKGFGGTSIDELIAAVGISKSGFFYHFRDKSELARELVARYIAEDDRIFEEITTRADELSEDPLHSYLISMKMLAELLDDMPNGHPGCLIASICHHEQLFDHDMRELVAKGMFGWRHRFRERLERIAKIYPPRIPVDLDDLADLMTVTADGGIILSKALSDPKALPRQILLYRDFIRLIFSPAIDLRAP